MRVSKQALSLIGAVLVALGLAGCGGGGSGGASTASGGQAQSPTPTPTPTLSAGWNASARVSNLRDGLVYTFYGPRVALTSGGVGFAVWNEAVSTCDSVWVNRYAAGAWGTSIGLGDTDALEPRIAANAAGDAVAVWTKRLWSSANCGGAIIAYEVWGSRYSAATAAWSAPVRISNAAPVNTGFITISPDVVLDSAGRATVIWLQGDSNTLRNIWQSRFDGAAWSAPALLSNGTRACNEPTLAQDGGGNVLVLWSQETNLYDPNQPAGGLRLPNIWAARRDAAGGAWSAPQRIGSADLSGADSVERPRVAANAGGQAMAVWEEWRGTKMSIVAARYVSGTWTVPVAIDAIAQNAYWPAVAIDVNGNAQAVWDQKTNAGDANESGYTARFSATSGSWGTPLLFEQNSEVVSGQSQVGLEDNGRASIAWEQWVAGQLPTHAIHYTPGGGFDSPVHFAGASPALAVVPDGTALLATNEMSVQGASLLVSIDASVFLP